MKRIALKPVLFLLLGAIINVAVAWGCVLWPRSEQLTRRMAPPPTEAELAWWQRSAPRGMIVPKEAIPLRGFGYEHAELYASGPTVNLGGSSTILMSQSRSLRVGFPLRSLYGEAHYIPDEQISDGKRVETWTFDLPENWRQFWPNQLGRLPLYPLWLGFAVNTGVYAAILWPLTAVPGFVRRRIRAHR